MNAGVAAVARAPSRSAAGSRARPRTTAAAAPGGRCTARAGPPAARGSPARSRRAASRSAGSTPRRRRATRRARARSPGRTRARSSPRCAAARRRAADEQRHAQICRRSISLATNTISSSDGVMRPLRPIRSACSSMRRLQNPVARHHHAEIDDLVAVAAEHDADDVLADVVHVALDGRQHDLALRRRPAALARLPAASSRSCSMNGSR